MAHDREGIHRSLSRKLFGSVSVLAESNGELIPWVGRRGGSW